MKTLLLALGVLIGAAGASKCKLDTLSSSRSLANALLTQSFNCNALVRCVDKDFLSEESEEIVLNANKYCDWLGQLEKEGVFKMPANEGTSLELRKVIVDYCPEYVRQGKDYYIDNPVLFMTVLYFIPEHKETLLQCFPEIYEENEHLMFEK
jgi:hypothetical protein